MSQPIEIEVQLEQLGIEANIPVFIPTVAIMVYDTAAGWTEKNPLLLKGQIGYETNTSTLQGSVRVFKCKVFDGVQRWNQLPYSAFGTAAGDGGSVQWNDVQGKPLTFPPSAHTHDWTSITDKPTKFNPENHEHELTDVIGLIDELVNKADRDQTETALQQLQEKKADLINGLIPTSQIPALAISEFLGDVSSQSAMLALGAQRTDTCFRTDLQQWFYAISDNTAHPSGWRPITTPVSGVISINGQTGVVILSKADLGLGNVPNTDATQRSNHQGTQLSNTISNFLQSVRETNLFGISDFTNQQIVGNDTILAAFAKLQGQLNNNKYIINAQGADGTAVTGTSSAVTYALNIPANTIISGDVLRLRLRVGKTGTAGTCTIRVHVNSTPDLSGSPVLLGQAQGTATQLYLPFRRDYAVKAAGTQAFAPSTNSFNDDGAATGSISNVSIDWTQLRFLVVSIQLSVGTDSAIGQYVSFERLRT